MATAGAQRCVKRPYSLIGVLKLIKSISSSEETFRFGRSRQVLRDKKGEEATVNNLCKKRLSREESVAFLVHFVVFNIVGEVRRGKNSYSLHSDHDAPITLQSKVFIALLFWSSRICSDDTVFVGVRLTSSLRLVWNLADLS